MRKINGIRIGAVAAAIVALSVGVANAAVNLEWRVTPQVVNIGNNVSIGLFAVSDSQANQSMSAVDAIINWDSTYLQLTGVTNNSPYAWGSSEFPNDCGLDGLNGNPICPVYTGTSFNDGNAFYRAQRNLGAPAFATPGGLLVATFNFTALLLTPSTMITIPTMAGMNTETVVVDGFTAGLPVTGTLGNAVITVVPEPATLALVVLGSLSLVRRRRPR